METVNEDQNCALRHMKRDLEEGVKCSSLQMQGETRVIGEERDQKERK